MTNRYGWIPDLPDHRDHLYAAPSPVLAALPKHADLRGACPPVYNQGQLNSCTGNAIAAAVEFDLMRQKADFMPSRLFIYWNERVMEHSTAIDQGAMIRDGIKSIGKQGNVPETLWPYDEAKVLVAPPSSVYAAAKPHQAGYQRLTSTNLNQLKGCLAAGFPFVFGFSVYDSFESNEVAETGVVPMPGPDESRVGGHAVLAVGYDDATERFIVRNSWGTGWGLKGYCTMPYAYLTQTSLATDFWTVRVVA